PLVLGLYWERANAWGALSSMLFGGSSYLLLNIYGMKPLGLHAIVPTLLLGLLAFLLGNKLGEHHQPATEPTLPLPSSEA
ncbi:MAG: sodium/pantothenate symporter, partial [Plesiomonas sp.]